MDADERQILRAQLVASGIIRYWQWDKSKAELDRWLEIMTEELGRLKDSDAAVKIPENLLTHGLRVPETSQPVHVDAPVGSQIPVVIDDVSDGRMCKGLPKADASEQAVHPGANSDEQAQQNPDTCQGQEVCGTYKNIYPSKDDAVYVRPPHIGDLKPKQNAGHETNETLGTGSTLAIYKEGLVTSKGPTGSWTWRNWNYNRVPPALEQAVYEKFKEGWSKSRLARKKLGIEKGGFHSMRHGAASALLADGASPALVQRQLRYSDPRITLAVYAHVLGDQQRTAVQNRSTRLVN